MAVEFVPFGRAIVPTGGTAGQVLVKNSGNPFDVAWGTVTADGGTPGTGYVTDEELAEALEQQTSDLVTTTVFTTALNQKQDIGDYITAVMLSQVEQSLQQALGTKAPLTHTQTISTVTGLQGALDAKSDDGHTHTVDEITDVTDFAAELLTADTQGDALGALGAMADDAVIPRSQVDGLPDELAKRPVFIDVASEAAWSALPTKNPDALYGWPA